MLDSRQSLKLDVAVIGAGAAGLYSAYRLLTGNDATGARKKRTVAVFEATERVGGRLHSVHLSPSCAPCELGAMRYLSNHNITNSLVERTIPGTYGLKSMRFECGGPKNFLYCLRSRRTYAIECEDAGQASAMYHVGTKWRGKTMDEIYHTIVSEVLEADGLNLKEIQSDPGTTRLKWNQVKENLRYRFKGPYQDRLVHELGFWHVIRDQTDQETFNFLQAVDGYDSTPAWSATDAFVAVVEDHTDETEYTTVEGGLDRISQCLAEEIEAAGGQVFTETALQCFSRSKTGELRYELEMFCSKTRHCWTVLANDILLCVPRRGLELLDSRSYLFQKDAILGGRIRKNIASVTAVPATKIVLSFTEPWWQERIGLRGKAVTDLPLRQCYYFGACDAGKASSLLVASYADMGTTFFWTTLQDVEKEREGEDVNGGGRATAAGRTNTNRNYTASKAVVGEAMKQLRELHGESVRIPEPCDSAFRDWGEDPHGAAYHLWRPGVKGWEVAAEMRRPFQDEGIYIAGEAYSDMQGWVEGALCSAERVLREGFQLAAPGWLDREYYLGW